MSLVRFCVCVTALLYVVSAAGYIRKMLRKGSKIHPVLGAWILALVAFSMSSWVYWHGVEHSIEGNIGNLAGTLNVWIIFLSVLWKNVRDKTLQVAFNASQVVCLAIGAVVALVWLFTPYDGFAYVLTQVICVIATYATWKKLRVAEQSSEPIEMWLLVVVACFFAAYPSWLKWEVKGDWKGLLYIFRAIPSTWVIVCQINRLNNERRQRYQQVLAQRTSHKRLVQLFRSL